jgi:hypothetical protein
MAEIKITVGIKEVLGILAVAVGARDSIARNGRCIPAAVPSNPEG